jgi:hypothetical protein
MSTTLFDSEADVSTATELRVIEPTPATMLQAAMDAQLAPEALEKYMQLYERWEDRQAERAYNEAMNACQAEIMPVIRTKFNNQTSSYYAALEDVDEMIRPIYTRHGFSLVYGSAESPMSEHYRCTVEVRHKDGHKTFAFMDAPRDDKGMKGTPNKTPVQGVVSTMAYLRRTLTCMVFNIPMKGQDKDGQRPQNVPCITDEQVAKLNEWMIEKEVKLEDFLTWAEVDALDALPMSKYTTAIQMLKERKPGARR